jgi:hypothetical protein
MEHLAAIYAPLERDGVSSQASIVSGRSTLSMAMSLALVGPSWMLPESVGPSDDTQTIPSISGAD